jgi:hypothetical protein
MMLDLIDKEKQKGMLYRIHLYSYFRGGISLPQPYQSHIKAMDSS